MPSFASLRQQAMRFDRIGRRVRERMHRRSSPTTPIVPMLAALQPARVPDLAQEHGDGRFAVGAGDRRDRLRLRAEKCRRHARQPRAGIFVGDEAHAERFRIALHLRCAEHDGGAALHRVADELSAIRTCAGQARQRDSRASPRGCRSRGPAIPFIMSMGLVPTLPTVRMLPEYGPIMNSLWSP